MRNVTIQKKTKSIKKIVNPHYALGMMHDLCIMINQRLLSDQCIVDSESVQLAREESLSSSKNNTFGHRKTKQSKASQVSKALQESKAPQVSGKAP